MGTGRASAAPDEVHDLDDAPSPRDADLDGAQGVRTATRTAPRTGSWRQFGGPWPAALPTRARGPAAAIAVVLAVAAISTSVTAAHLGSTQAARQRALEARLSLQVGQLQVSSAPGQAGTAPTQVDLDVPLLNRGSRTMTVTVLGITGAHQHALHPAAPVHVAPGTTLAVPLSLAVDCVGVPDANGTDSTTAPAVEVLARVALPPASGARSTEVSLRLPTFQDAAEQLGGSLADTCHPYLGGQLSSSWTYPASGEAQLRFTNENDSGTPALTLSLTQTPGLRATSRPALPLVVPPGHDVVVSLAVDPDCAVVGDGRDSYLGIGLADPDGTLQDDLGAGWGSSAGQEGTVGWLARSIALRCG